MRLSSQEEYGLRCLLQVARRSPGPEAGPTSIRDVADAEGLSPDYAAKLLRLLRQADLLVSTRGAEGGYALSRSAGQIPLAAVLGALDGPLFDEAFCDGHSGQLESCVHTSNCTVMAMWQQVGAALDAVLSRFTIADLLPPGRILEAHP
jgi:Rrf2 family protein